MTHVISIPPLFRPKAGHGPQDQEHTQHLITVVSVAPPDGEAFFGSGRLATRLTPPNPIPPASEQTSGAVRCVTVL